MLIQGLRRYDPRGRLRKNHLFDPFWGRFTPIRPTNRRWQRKRPPTVSHPGNVSGPNVHLATVLPPHALRRRDQRVQVVRRPSPAGYCLTPTADLSKSEQGPIATRGSTISVCHQTGRLVRTNRSFSSHSLPHNRWPFWHGSITGHCNPWGRDSLQLRLQPFQGTVQLRAFPGGNRGEPPTTCSLRLLNRLAPDFPPLGGPSAGWSRSFNELRPQGLLNPPIEPVTDGLCDSPHLRSSAKSADKKSEVDSSW